MPCTRNQYKFMAILFMVIDHVGLFLLNNNIFCRAIGRLAFPMFVYLLADGYRRTKDVGKYLFRLAVLYAISYIPHSLAMSGGLFYQTQNIYASQFLYLILFYFLDKAPAWGKILAGATAFLISVVLPLQYGWYGVGIAIVLFYMHDFGVANTAASLLILGMIYGGAFPLQALGALSVYLAPFMGVFIESPRPNKALQWISYFFYPVHLMFFAILRL